MDKKESVFDNKPPKVPGMVQKMRERVQVQPRATKGKRSQSYTEEQKIMAPKEVVVASQNQDRPQSFQKDCPICMCIMIEPCQLSCGHRFCIQCIKNMNANTKKHSCCPYCRSALKIKQFKSQFVDISHQQKLEMHFPDEFKKQYQVLKKQDLLFSERISIIFEVGNTNEMGENNWCCQNPKVERPHICHKWSCILRPYEESYDKYMPQLFETVTFKLSYSNEKLKDKVIHPKSDEEMSITKQGCEELKIPIIIEFKNQIQKPITICHVLDLEGEGSLRKFVVDITKRQFENIKKRYNSDNLAKKQAGMQRGNSLPTILEKPIKQSNLGQTGSTIVTARNNSRRGSRGRRA